MCSCIMLPRTCLTQERRHYCNPLYLPPDRSLRFTSFRLKHSYNVGHIPSLVKGWASATHRNHLERHRNISKTRGRVLGDTLLELTIITFFQISFQILGAISKTPPFGSLEHDTFTFQPCFCFLFYPLEE
ncbi:hypothetical protein BT69DRAFT_865713 [Atractiella rhizophila]|nr:hypothetical protein BT69DRAFT_865713 [Atractiella rhizophila]